MEEEELLKNEDNESSRISSHSHGSIETYDIFRDPPKSSPSMEKQSSVASPFANHYAARTESSLGESG
jgi:hypothetical protein